MLVSAALFGATADPVILDDFNKLSEGGKVLYNKFKDVELTPSKRHTTRDRMDSYDGNYEIVKTLDGDNGNYYLWYIDKEKRILFIK